MKSLLLFLPAFLGLVSVLAAATIAVPADFASIQEAIDYAGEGDTVLVAPGHYVENLNFYGKNIVLASHYILNGEVSYIPQTIIDGNDMGAVVTFENNESNQAVLTGFTIQKGGHDMSQPDPTELDHGGGIICLNASPTIMKNTIINCDVTVFNASDFGAVYCQNSSAVIADNTIDSTYVGFTAKGGGIVANNSNLEIRNNIIRNIWGGYTFLAGSVVADSSTLTFISNIIHKGTFDHFPYTSSIKLLNCTAFIKNNTCLGEIAMDYDNDIELVNNILLTPMVEGPIVQMSHTENLSINARFNLIQGSFPGQGNFDDDPLFEDPENYDFRLTAESPCIDAGDPATENDPDGTRADIGAIYFDQSVTSSVTPEVFRICEVFPNPASTSVHFRLAENHESVNLQIFCENGSKVSEEAFSGSDFVLNTAGFSPGVYFFVLTGHGIRIKRGKFVIL